MNSVQGANAAATNPRRPALVVTPSAGGADLCAEVALDPASAQALARALSGEGTRYEHYPEDLEAAASGVFASTVPELVRAVRCAMNLGCHLVRVSNFVVPDASPPTPLDGAVNEDHVGYYIRILTGALTSNIGLCGFAYDSENGGRLLRAVAPTPEKAHEASSQGFDLDLENHHDNIDRPLLGLESLEVDGHLRAPMNPYQAFVAIRPKPEVPMQVMALADVIAQVERAHGRSVIEQLERPQFTVRRPASHGGGFGAHHLPVLFRDGAGRFHGRMHPENVKAETAEGKAALECLQFTIASSTPSMKLDCRQGDLILYSNTRSLHRRERFSPSLDGTDRYYARLYLMAREWQRNYGNTRVLAQRGPQTDGRWLLPFDRWA